MLFPHAEFAVRASERGEISAEFRCAAAGGYSAQRLVEALSLGVHRRGEHGADLGFGGEEMTVEISHRRVRNRFGQEEWRYGRGRGLGPVGRVRRHSAQCCIQGRALQETSA